MFDDLLDRLRRADRELHLSANEASYRNEQIRLRGKREGVRLAISYVEELLRDSK